MVLLDNLPIWAVYLGTVVLVLVAAEIGYRIGLALVIMLFVFVTFNDIVRLAGI